MDSDVVVRLEHVSKKFCKSLKRGMAYGITDLTRNLLGMRSKSEVLRKGEFWAVDDVSFELRRGETLGLLGANGAGKTTILQLINGIFWPDKGKVTVRGRVGSLIAVGAGFHPQLTGRENIFVNAAIMGMSRREAERKFDQIVEFAEIGDFLDTPVKHYSSGMYVRLGFAIAAHCDPDVLLVDEVLAVGDMSFQSRCLTRLSTLRRSGAAILVVTHSEEYMRRACQKGVLLANGRVLVVGSLDACYHRYRAELGRASLYDEVGRTGSRELEIADVVFVGSDGRPTKILNVGEPFTVRIPVSGRAVIFDPTVEVSFNSQDGYVGTSFATYCQGVQLGPITGGHAVSVHVPALHLAPGVYRISAVLALSDTIGVVDWRRNNWTITVQSERYVRGAAWHECEWRVERNGQGVDS